MEYCRGFCNLTWLIGVVMLTALSIPAIAIESNDFVSHLTLQPAETPLLQLETGRHTDLVTVISTDRQGHFLLTASEDKTARLWDIKSGKLLHTYRMPVGSTEQGKLYAVAISPDGRYLAIGGYLGYDWEFSFSIYIIETETGKVVKRISKLGNMANHLVFSHDGHYLAGLLGYSGLKVWDVNHNYAEIASDNDYEKRTYWADFSSRGELVTTSEDGFVRLYDKSFKLKKKSRIVADKTPVGVSFSPDGRNLVIGFLQAHSIVVASSEDLSVILLPDVSGIKQGDIAVVKWSQSGAIYAGGNYKRQGETQIRRWAEGGYGEYHDFSCGKSTIMDFNILHGDQILSVDSEPIISLLTNEGIPLYRLESGAALQTIVGNELFVSPDGSDVEISLWRHGHTTGHLQFDTTHLKLSQPKLKSAHLLAPKTNSEKIKVNGWHGGSRPSLDGSALKLDLFERSNALAISDDDSFFLLGTSQSIRCYNRRGMLEWKHKLPVSVRSLNLSVDGNIVVAVLADHTLRWFSAKNGEALLSLFVHSDLSRWVAWTPEGYFSYSSNGGGLAGYLVNSDKNSLPLFLTFSELKKQLKRPQELRTKIRGHVAKDVEVALRKIIAAAIIHRNQNMRVQKFKIVLGGGVE